MCVCVCVRSPFRPNSTLTPSGYMRWAANGHNSWLNAQDARLVVQRVLEAGDSPRRPLFARRFSSQKRSCQAALKLIDQELLVV